MNREKLQQALKEVNNAPESSPALRAVRVVLEELINEAEILTKRKAKSLPKT